MGVENKIDIDKPTLDGLYLKEAYYIPAIRMVYTSVGKYIGYWATTGYFSRAPNMTFTGNLPLLEQRVKDLIAMEEL